MYKKIILILLVLLMLFPASTALARRGRILPDWKEPEVRHNQTPSYTQEDIDNHPGCGVSGEFGLVPDSDPCPYDPWNDGFYPWFDPKLEFAWMYQD